MRAYCFFVYDIDVLRLESTIMPFNVYFFFHSLVSVYSVALIHFVENYQIYIALFIFSKKECAHSS